MSRNFIIALFMLAFARLGFSQSELKVSLIDGEIKDTTFVKIDNQNFGFKIDCGQSEQDTCKYEFIHARGNSPFSKSRGLLVGRSTQFVMQDVRRVIPGDRFVFNLEMNGRKFSQSYHVLSTKASENKPWFFNLFFLVNGDTINTENYQVYFSFPADSTKTTHFKTLSKNVKSNLIKTAALQCEDFPRFIRYYFTRQDELPPSIVINYEKYQLTFEFRVASFHHGDILAKFSPKKKIHDDSGNEFNSAVEFIDKDVDGWGSSTLFNHYFKEERGRRRSR
jgi:hypothetical protein